MVRSFVLSSAMLIDHTTGEILSDFAEGQGYQVDYDLSSDDPTVAGRSHALKRIVTGAEYLALPRAPATWLVEPLLPTGGVMLLYGDAKVGKSYVSLQFATALATGQDWLGFRTLQPRRVVYIQLDTPRSLWAERIAALRTAGLPTDAVWFADRETLGTWPFDILNSDHQVILSDALATLSPDCVILDTMREAHRGDENDATDMQNVLSHLTAAVKPAALVIVAHGRKASPDRRSSLINDNRGSNYVVGAVDAIAHLTSKGMEVGGRAVEETFVHLERHLDGTWNLHDRDRTKQVAREVLSDPEGGSLRERARVLAVRTGKDEDACLSLLRRLKE